MAPAAKKPVAKKASAKTVKVGVKRERSTSVTPTTPIVDDPDVYKTLAKRMGGQELFSFTDNEDKTTPKSAVSIADVVPYMWKEKPLDATLKKLLKDARSKEYDFTALIAQVEQLNRRFSVTWNDCVFSGLSADETAEKMSLDPQAWLITETAMEIILQVKYPQEELGAVQEALRKYKSMVPLETLLNPATGMREWERVAYLVETYFKDCKKWYKNAEEEEKRQRLHRQQVANLTSQHAASSSASATNQRRMEFYLALVLATLSQRGIPPPLQRQPFVSATGELQRLLPR